MEEILRVENIHKKYGKKEVVKGVSLKIQSNSIFGLLGPNGAGKTTTFYMIVGIEKPNEGKIFYDGDDITSLPMYRRALLGINYLPQESSIFRKLSVEDNIKAIIELQKLPAIEAKKKLDTLLEFLNIGHIKNSYGFSLSGGERRRVEIARALATDPKLLLLDEPFSGIDPITIIDIQQIIIKLVQEFGVGIIITDHNVRETLKITDYAAILVDGQIFAQGSTEEITQDKGVRQVYLGENFKLD